MPLPNTAHTVCIGLGEIAGNWVLGVFAVPTKTPPRGVASLSLVRLAGIEPTTLGFGGQYSIH